AGVQEVITYALTSPEAEAKLKTGQSPGTEVPGYVTLLNPISPERSVMRRSLLPGALAVAAENLKSADGVALFELGPVYLPKPGPQLPDEPRRLAIVLGGRRSAAAWDDPLGTKPPPYDFYDLKGVLEGLAADLHLRAVAFEPAKDVPHLHPGRSARLLL